MKVKSPAPAANLTAYVDRILVIEDHRITSPFSLPLFANGSPTLVFSSAKGTLKKESTTNLTLFGQTILPETLTFTEDFTLIAYFFKPYALGALFNITALELTDKPVDGNLLLPQKTTRLQEQLLNAFSTETRLTILDSYIAGLIAHSKDDCAKMRYAADRLAADSSAEVLSSVVKELYMTTRTFQRQFEKNIGLSPNLYRRICQFNSAFQQLNSRGYHKLSDIALRNGYADQSHYIRSFKEFTNITPKEYLNFGSES